MATIIAFALRGDLTEVNESPPSLFDLYQQRVEIRESNEAAALHHVRNVKKG